MNERIDPYVAYRLQLLQEGQALRSLWERMSQGEPEARDRLARFLHRLHGTSGTYGYDKVSALAHDLREELASKPPRVVDESKVEPLLAALLEASLGDQVSQPVGH
jgi:chemotaxis protein histidine kinase CheA